VAGSRVSIIDHFSLKKGCTVNQNVKFCSKKFNAFLIDFKLLCFSFNNFCFESFVFRRSTMVLKFALNQSILFEQYI